MELATIIQENPILSGVGNIQVAFAIIAEVFLHI